MRDQADTLRKMMGSDEPEFSMLPTVLVFERSGAALSARLGAWFANRENLADADHLNPGAYRDGARVRAAAMDGLDERLLRWHPDLLAVILLAAGEEAGAWAEAMARQVLKRREGARIGVVAHGALSGGQGRGRYEAFRRQSGGALAGCLTYLGHWGPGQGPEESSGGWLRGFLLHFERNGADEARLRMVARRIVQAGVRFKEEPARIQQASASGASHEVRA